MKKLLILLTSVYPTSTGDMFVHEELKYLASEFNKILIFPVNNTAKLEARVEIQAPSELHLTNQRSSTAARLRDIYYLLKSWLQGSEQTRYERAHRVKNLKQALYLYFAEGRAKQVLKDTRTIIDEAIQAGGYSELVVYSYWMSIPARAALLIQEDIKQRYPELKIRSYSRGHGYDIYDEASASGFQPFRRALIEGMDALFPCSQYGVDYMKERFLRPAQDDNIYLSRLGVPDPLALRGKDWEDMRGLRQGQIRSLHLVSCSRVVPLKRLDLIVDGLAQLRGKGLDLKWTHFGGGPGLDDLRERAKQALDFMPVDIRGQVEHEVIMDFYCSEAIDLFVNVSSSEGVPVSVMEALATGIPTAATDVGGTSEIVLERGGSILWPADLRAEMIAQTIENFAMHDAEARWKRAGEARQIWVERSDSSRNYQEMAAVLAAHVDAQDVPFNYGEIDSYGQ